MMKGSRKPDIMADAAYAILTKDSGSYTGNFAIDENVLKEVGVSDLDHYSYQPGAQLIPDFFIDDPNAEAVMHAYGNIFKMLSIPQIIVNSGYI